MNAPLPSSSLRPLRKAPLFIGLALACAGMAAQAAERDSASRFERRLDEHRVVAQRQLAMRAAGAPAAALRPAGTTAVTNCDDSGDGSLRQAVTDAATGDVIDLSALSCSTITLTSGALATSASDLTVEGPGAASLAIDGGNADRIFDHTGSGTLTVSDLTLRNGAYIYEGPFTYGGSAQGGCILSTGFVTIERSALDHCTVDGGQVSGGAIRAMYAVRLTDSTVTGTTATASTVGFSAGAYGGAIYAAAIYLTNTVISGVDVTVTGTETAFSGSLGGGILGFAGAVLVDSTVTGVSVSVDAPKDAYAAGAGIAVRGVLYMDRSTVSNNTTLATPGIGPNGDYVYHSQSRGGGIYIGRTPEGAPHSSLITNSTISGNAALVDGDPGDYTYNGGGGIDTQAQLVVRIGNSTLSGNSAVLKGGALYTFNRGSFQLSNTTITDNTANAGSAIADTAGLTPYQLDVGSSIIAGNHTLDSASFEIETTHEITGANNLIASANVALPEGTLTGDPMLAPLADNGGPTWTHALLAGSPAIDAGNNGLAFETDQRGDGYSRVVGVAADIGAFETQGVDDTVFANGFD